METLIKKLMKPIIEEVYQEGYRDGERRILKAFEYGYNTGFLDGTAEIGAIDLKELIEDETEGLSERRC